MKVYLGQPWGGMGDNLQFSTLPRLYAEQGCEVYISSQNAYRSSEVHEFCWGNNPYVKGIGDHPPTIGACAPMIDESSAKNIIALAEKRHGFPGTGKYPEIYYQPNYLEEFSDKVIVDFSAHSIFNHGLGNIYNVDVLFQRIDESVPKENVLMVRFTNHQIQYLEHNFKFDYGIVEVPSIFKYADIIHSCKEHYSLFSGSNSISSGIKHQNNSNVKLNCFLYKPMSTMSGYFVFDNINYIDSF